MVLCSSALNRHALLFTSLLSRSTSRILGPAAFMASTATTTSAGGIPHDAGAKTGPIASGGRVIPGLVDDTWNQKAQTQRYPTLTQDLTSDVVVIGAGISGLSVAYQLRKGGANVTVLEARTRGSGQTGRTTAHIMMWIDDWYSEVESMYGTEKTKLVADSIGASIKWIEDVIKSENIDCDFQRLDGYLFPHDSKRKTIRNMEEEAEASKRAGLGAEMVQLDGSPSVGGITEAVRYPGCADFHPLKYLNGLAEACTRAGVAIYEMSPVAKTKGNGEIMMRNGQTVHAKEAIVMATCSPIHRNVAVHSRQSAFRTYALGLEIPHGSVRKAQFWDTNEPYHYIRTTEADGKEILLVGGEDHITGMRPNKMYDAWARLEEYARARWPQAGAVAYKWTGQVYEPADLLGLYGQDPVFDSLSGPVKDYIITGDSGQGMTGGTIGAMIVADLILGRPNPWSELYSPKRVRSLLKPTAVMELASEAAATTRGYLDVVAPRNLEDVKGAFSPSSVERDLKPGDGIVVEEGLKKMALYRDPDGTLLRRSGLCPHLGCAVEWNPNDRTFDCVCHGSQFDTFGRCINGPATQDLEDLGNK